MDNTLKFAGALVVIVVIGCIAASSAGLISFSGGAPASTTGLTSGNVTVYYFYGEECPHCHAVMPVVVNLSKKYPNVEFHILEIWHNQTNYNLYSRINTELKNPRTGVPVAFVGTTVVYGEWEIPNYLELAIQDQIKKKS